MKRRHSNNNNGSNNNRRPNNRGGYQKPRKNYAALREKYQNMAKEALSSGDRVQAEYYLQHAEHYHRAQEEYMAEREQRQAQRHNDGNNYSDDDDNFDEQDNPAPRSRSRAKNADQPARSPESHNGKEEGALPAFITRDGEGEDAKSLAAAGAE